MVDICCIGHITSDKVVTRHGVSYMPGGTAYYFSCALRNIDIRYLLVTALAFEEMHYVADLRNTGVNIKVQHSAQTVYFENIYAEDQDQRTQNVWQQADPFSMDQLADVTARIFHLGPLLAGDIPTAIIKALAAKGRVSLDVQGYLRKVENNKVHTTDWREKKDALAHVEILKADVTEVRALTGCKEVNEGAELLADWGIKEVVVTNGSSGSVIYCAGVFYTIPAFHPQIVVDATGCGDTYMAGYLYRRLKGDGIQQAGEFAAAMASLKMESPGPFIGTETEVMQLLVNSRKMH